MAKLNWTEQADIKLLHSVNSPHRYGTEVRLALPRVQALELMAELRCSFMESKETKVALTSRNGEAEAQATSWTLYFKACDGHSRFLLAHPELKTWVATLGIGRAEVLNFFERFTRAIEDGTVFDLGELADADRLSNIGLILSVS